MSYEDLGPAPDIENLDLSAMDRGDSIPANAPEVKDDPKPEEKVEEKVEDKKDDPAEEPEDKDEDEEEQSRDDKGRFEKKEARIPKSRFDEQVGKERAAREAAEARAAELEAQLRSREQSQQQQIDRTTQIDKLEDGITALEKKHAELLLDGNVDEAAKVMKDIRHTERQIARLEANAESNQVVDAKLEEGRMQLAIAQLEADYPVLNPKSETYDSDLVEMILLKQNKMVNEGHMPSQALRDATKSVMDRFAKTPEPEAEKEGLSKAEQEDRKQKQVEKALDTQKRQPSSMKEVGLDSDKAGEKGLPDISTMSSDEFDALPATTKARLRGDMV